MSKKINSTDVSLTAAEFKQEGIDVKLNQNDLLEIVAEAKYLETLETIESYSHLNVVNKVHEIYAEELEEVEASKILFAKEIHKLNPEIEYGDILNKIKTSFKENFRINEGTNIYYLTKTTKGNSSVEVSKYTFQVQPFPIIEGKKISLYLSVELLIDSITESGIKCNKKLTYTNEVLMKFKKDSKKETEFLTLRDEISDYIKSLGDSGDSNTVTLNFNSMLRNARITMNKNIIKSQSEVLKKALKQNFNLEL